MLLIFFGPSSTAHAQESETPANDCWNGALSSDPLHCYVLEEAEDAGHIDIAAMYRGGDVLFIYLTQTEPVGDSIRDYIRTKAQEEARRTGLYDCVLDPYGCGNGVLPIGTGFILPPSEVYENIYLKPGGAEARRSEPGWPAFRQLWPSIADGAAAAYSGFDVSEVDMTNFPEVDCARESLRGFIDCARWERHPGHGIAGWNSDGETLYVQVKASSAEDANATAAKEALIAWNPKGLNEDNVVIIPVKYDYEDLWRWAKVINRFAYTSGNTLGITGSWMGQNWETYAGDAVYPVAEIPEVGRTPVLNSYVPSELRTTIHVMAMELQRTVAALPQLLGQLNVPVDAVGVVAEVDRTPSGRPVPEPGVASANVGAEPGASGPSVGAGRVEESDSSVSVSTWMIAGGAGIAGLVVLASVVFLTVRLRRRVI